MVGRTRGGRVNCSFDKAGRVVMPSTCCVSLMNSNALLKEFCLESNSGMKAQDCEVRASQ
jgi:hypothetical protein